MIKRLRRGQTLADAVELFRGEKTDVAASPFSLEDQSGKRWFGVVRAEAFYTSSWLPAARERRRAAHSATGQGQPARHLRRHADRLDRRGLVAGRPGPYLAGDLIGYSWSQFVATGKLPKIELVFRPTAKQALQGVGVTKNELLVNISDNVAVKVMAYRKTGGAWSSRKSRCRPTDRPA